MSNRHIKLVEKWLDDPSSVSTRELKENAAYASYASAAAASAAAASASDSDAAYASDAIRWVATYKALEQTS